MEKNFDETITYLLENKDFIHDREDLKRMAIDYVEHDMEFVAIHILEALKDSMAEYFDYDYCMGTLETPTPLETMEDLQYYLEEES